MAKLSDIWDNAELMAKAQGRVFNAPRVLKGTTRVRFIKVQPSGNISVKFHNDPEYFGPVTLSRDKCDNLAKSIAIMFGFEFE